ncbi:MAG TPA: hypothetical protein VMD49_05010 [Steroidobacteraceae bacterium]|jgi:hypothetical protein|nr:hypothetical protein [Steroidobacteraceae bacterium]
MSYSGRCHCGALGYEYRTAVPPAAWTVRACQCTFCRAHGALTSSDPGGSLRFVIEEPGCLVRYRFGLRTAEFLLCGRCGVYLGALITTPRGRFGIVNLNALRPPLAALPPAVAVSYESEDELQRTARRETRWTPLGGA